ncbi:uncharacterized protein BXZ73DRAFT_105759 [Epithele typhae]|uniref:uncharacterized protein n=1 Tax=Epithele typhae TaxID=378194 RepID=UPI002007DD49|nr:uncharacterized protein BXZ73DRAFT_105759 [Epithele typhae]KAH9916564.1 hypothetical protein BXZ73DRAFT_105759 [Epithele typhae]
MAPTESLTAESGHSEPTTANVRDEEFWFDDGSIILLVQNVEFRIYKGLLTEHSSAFVDLFSLPQPPTQSSCPVVRTQNQYPPMLSFEQVAAYVRLSHKYDMPVLYRASIAHLKRHFTDDLRVWPTLLPTALWMCCRLGPELLSGFAYSDGEVETLAAADVALCWAARPRLVQATLQTFLSIYPAPSAETCSAGALRGDDSGCRRFATSFVHKMRHKPGIFVAPDPLIGYINMDGPSGKKLCEGCREGVVQWSEKVYFEAWKSLPELVGVEVPGWTEAASPNQTFSSKTHHFASMRSKKKDKRSKIQDIEKFYFDDGTIILFIQGVHFRVHMGILAMHSPVFTDMATLGSVSHQVDATGGNLDPCPIVELQDSVYDWRHALRVIYNIKPLKSIGDKTYRPTFDEVSAYIRLGHKYQMDAFYKPAMVYLERFFSPTIDRWNKWSSRDDPYTLPGCAPECAIGIVNLARLTGKTSLLPLALLSCCQLGGRLLECLARPDGTHETLSPEDLKRCLSAINHLTSDGIYAMQLLIGTRPEESCPNTQLDYGDGTCTGGIRELLADFQDDSSQGVPIQPTPFVQPDMYMLCEECRGQIQDKCNEINQDTLSRLASFFDL